MACQELKRRNELIDLVSQAVLDRLEERGRIHSLADEVVERVLALQAEEASLAKSASKSS